MKHERRETLSWAPSGVRPFWSWLPPQLEGDFMVKEKASWIFRKGAGRAEPWVEEGVRPEMVLWVEGQDLSRKFLKRRWKVADAKSIAAMTPRASLKVEERWGWPGGNLSVTSHLLGMTSCSMFAPARPPTPRPEKPEEVTVSRRVAPFDSKAGAAATALPWVRRKLRQ